MEHLAKVVSEMDVRLRAVCTVVMGLQLHMVCTKFMGAFSPSKLLRRGVTSAEAVVVIL